MLKKEAALTKRRQRFGNLIFTTAAATTYKWHRPIYNGGSPKTAANCWTALAIAFGGPLDNLCGIPPTADVVHFCVAAVSIVYFDVT